MSDTKICPACNQAVPVLAVRCRYCGIRLTPQNTSGSMDALQGITEVSVISAPPPPRVSAPPSRLSAPPPSRGMSAPPPPIGSSVPPPAAFGIPRPGSLTPIPAFSSSPSLGAPARQYAPDNVELESFDDDDLMEDSDVSPLDAEVGIAPPAAVPPRPPVASSVPPPPRASIPVSHGVVTPPPQPAVSAQGGNIDPKKTLLGFGMAQQPSDLTPAFPQQMPDVPPPPAAVSPFSAASYASDAYGGGFMQEATALGDMYSAHTSQPASAFDRQAGEDDPFESLDLEDDDVLMAEIDGNEMKAFNQQTAITNISDIAQEMTTDAFEDDLPPDLLEEMDLPELSMESASDDAELFQLDAEPSAYQRRVPPPAKRGFLESIPRMYLYLSGGIAACLVLIIVVMIGRSGSDDATQTAAEGAESASTSSGEADKAASGDVEKSATDKSAAKKTLLPHKCKKMTDYPPIPWRDKLDAVLAATGKESLCQLFDIPEDKVTAALKSELHLGPTGYDLLPKSKIVELYPTGQALRRGPTMEFIFVDGKLFEIRLKYMQTAASELGERLFSIVLPSPPSSPKDALDRTVTRYIDDDMGITRFYRKDAYNREFNEIVFFSKLMEKSMTNELDQRDQALVEFYKGMGLFTQQKSQRAIAQFRKAQRLMPAMGDAFVYEGITLLRSEQFDSAAIVARKALENSTDDRAKASALGLQAVISVFSGFKDMALELFSKASKLDPADAEFATSAQELETDEYAPSRVAKTAARMSCMKKHREWTEKGLLARGNFPDLVTYDKAYKRARRDSSYQGAFDMWAGWECQ